MFGGCLYMYSLNLEANETLIYMTIFLNKVKFHYKPHQMKQMIYAPHGVLHHSYFVGPPDPCSSLTDEALKDRNLIPQPIVPLMEGYSLKDKELRWVQDVCVWVEFLRCDKHMMDESDIQGHDIVSLPLTY